MDGAIKLVGSDRVLAVLVRLAALPDGATLDELVHLSGDPRPTVHRALAALVRAGLARNDRRGHYILGDEFIRLAFAHHEARPDTARVTPVLERLAERFGETAHYAALDGRDVVYRAKVDPSVGAVRLNSVVGGRKPAHATGVGKALLAAALRDRGDVARWVGDRPLEQLTPATVATAEELADRLVQVRRRGYAVDAEESQAGVNCVAFAVHLGSPSAPSGAISVSAVAYRTPLRALEGSVDEIRAILREHALTAELSA